MEDEAQGVWKLYIFMHVNLMLLKRTCGMRSSINRKCAEQVSSWCLLPTPSSSTLARKNYLWEQEASSFSLSNSVLGRSIESASMGATCGAGFVWWSHPYWGQSWAGQTCFTQLIYGPCWIGTTALGWDLDLWPNSERLSIQSSSVTQPLIGNMWVLS